MFRFYSKLVRLEEYGITKQDTHAEVFLFQIGAIRSSMFLIPRMLMWGFLFQIGAIRRDTTLGRGYMLLNSFYSKLVRLEAFAVPRLGDPQHRFYSKLVRLEVVKVIMSKSTKKVSIPNWCD